MSNVKTILRKIVLLAGDWAGLYLALLLMLVVRYGNNWTVNWELHFRPFSLVFPIWIIILFSMYLYETRFIRFRLDTVRAIGTATTLALIASITAFYAIPPGLIQPRRNMVIFAVIYTLILLAWRWSFYRVSRNRIKTTLLFIGGSSEVEELTKYFELNPHFGYVSKGVVDKIPEDPDKLSKRIHNENIRLVVIKPSEENETIKNLFPLLSSGVTAIDLEEFYEQVFNKVSPEMLTDLWFIRNLENLNAEFYKFTKRSTDILISMLGLFGLIIIYPITALIIKIDSSGPIIFKQKRIGKNGKEFYVYKFRTMKALNRDGSAETEGAVWAKENDSRITKVGSFMRKTRIDELPQLWNVFVGEMSFVGPRPERPEFIKDLEKHIPYYNMRHLVRPGITGWAQINYEYGNSTEDARIKLQYDIYYAKKSSFALDLTIILKTIKTVLTRQGQ